MRNRSRATYWLKGPGGRGGGYVSNLALICGDCGTIRLFVNRENTWCPECRRCFGNFAGPCDVCGAIDIPSEKVDYVPLD